MELSQQRQAQFCRGWEVPGSDKFVLNPLYVSGNACWIVTPFLNGLYGNLNAVTAQVNDVKTLVKEI